jgi:phosphatidylserine/phosphatidylglycerophosphate/cardiolipin synthase-like enzyme
MNTAALVGGALLDAPDPAEAAALLCALLTDPGAGAGAARRCGFEPSVVEALRHALPTDRARIEAACAAGAAWVIGRRSAPAAGIWELVATLRWEARSPNGLRRTTAETLIGLVSQAVGRLRCAAPYVDPIGIGFFADAIAGATACGVAVEVFEPAWWEPGEDALQQLRHRVRDHGDPGFLRMVRRRAEAPWSHLKVLAADGTVAYVGSANLTAAGLAGGNLELGVLVRGPDVHTIEELLDLYRVDDS